MQRLVTQFDEVILYVLNLENRIERSGGHQIDPTDEHRCILSLLQQASDNTQTSESFNDAKYAVVAWIDERLHAAPWDSQKQDWWINHCLEMELFGHSVAFTEFFNKAQRAMRQREPAVLEVYYVCVALGFRGCYRTSPLQYDQIDQSLSDLPPTLPEWAEEIIEHIPKEKDQRVAQTDHPGQVGAPPRQGRLQLVFPVLVGFALATVVVALGWKSLIEDVSQ